MENKQSNHFDGKRFFNPTLQRGEKKSFFKALSMWLSTRKAEWPRNIENSRHPILNLHPNPEQIAVTFINHVSFLLQLPGINILTDPVWCKRASPFKLFGPKRVRKPGIDLKDLPKIDLILISHNHYDHLDVKTLKKLNKRFKPKIFVPLGDGKLIRSLGFKEVYEFDWWNFKQLNNNLRIIFTPMQHWSARNLRDQYKSLWGSYVIEFENKKIFFGGDGGYCGYFKDIYKKFGPMDLSFLGIGSYEPRWFMKNMHTNPEEAVLAHLDLHSKLSIGMHFGTFQLSAESYEQPLLDLKEAKLKHGVETAQFITFEVGETKLINFP